MGEVQILDWIFEDPTIFLLLMPLVTGMIALATTKKSAIGIVVAYMSLVYSGYAQDELITGIMYISVVFVALLTASRAYEFVVSDQNI